MIDYSGWKFFDDYINGLNSEYCIYCYGDALVPTSKIKGLSYEGVLKDKKLNRLEQSIKESGYLLNKPFRDLNLYLFPN